MRLDAILNIAKDYNDLGWSVQEQLVNFVDGERDEDHFNPNALRMIRDFLADVEREADREGDAELIEDCTATIADIKDYLS